MASRSSSSSRASCWYFRFCVGYRFSGRSLQQTSIGPFNVVLRRSNGSFGILLRSHWRHRTLQCFVEAVHFSICCWGVPERLRVSFIIRGWLVCLYLFSSFGFGLFMFSIAFCGTLIISIVPIRPSVCGVAHLRHWWCGVVHPYMWCSFGYSGGIWPFIFIVVLRRLQPTGLHHVRRCKLHLFSQRRNSIFL